ncbi:hypothetical protein A2U01_0040968, partial [Trifolium medium]|nr:hypothetical protein [Trifolium medium]
ENNNGMMDGVGGSENTEDGAVTGKVNPEVLSDAKDTDHHLAEPSNHPAQSVVHQKHSVHEIAGQ